MSLNLVTFRREVWQDTEIKAKAYPLAIAPTKYEYDSTYTPSKRFSTTAIQVIDTETIDAGQQLLAKGLHPLLLNQTDVIQPGGMVQQGLPTQEASLYRRSNCCEALQDLSGLYPLEDEQAIYCPRITILKESEFNMYADCSPYVLDFVACPGIPFPSKTEIGDLSEVDKEIYRKKIELIFQIAAKNGHDSLVLGPLGCGGWGNPPRVVAFLFREILQKWEGVFSEVIFACLILQKTIPSLPNAYSKQPKTNYDLFSIVFSIPSS